MIRDELVNGWIKALRRSWQEGIELEKQGMSKKSIEKNLRKALLDDGPLAQALFEYELQEHVAEYRQSKWADGDKYFFAITEHTNDVAMLLIDESNHLHVNEDARAMLKKLWWDAYRHNLEILIPQMVEELNAGYLFTVGVTVTARGRHGSSTRS